MKNADQPKEGKMKPTIYFDYEFEKDAVLGDEAEFTVKGKFISLSKNEREGKTHHNQTLEISEIKRKGEDMDDVTERMKRKHKE